MAVANITTIPLKAGVDASGVTRELDAALGVARNVYAAHGQPLTITSLGEGVHLPNSKHYVGQAGDLRTGAQYGIDQAAIPGMVSDLKAQLGPEYTVIFEGDHIHIQFNGVGTLLDPAGGDVTADTPTPPAASTDFDLSSILGDLGLSDAPADYQAGISGGWVVGLGVAGIIGLALLFGGGRR